MVEAVRQQSLTTQERAEVLHDVWMNEYVAKVPKDLDRFRRLVSFGEHLMERSGRVSRRANGIPLSRLPHLKIGYNK